MKPIETIADYKKFLIDSINELFVFEGNVCDFAYLFEEINIRPSSCYDRALRDVLSIIRDDDNVK